jgi:hypothetical protein
MQLPFVGRAEFEIVVDERDRLRQELDDLQQILPFIEMAREIHIASAEILAGGDPDADVISLAYNRVRDQRIGDAKKERAAMYESEHRHELYKRLVAEVEQEEGADILARVQQRVETDPKLAQKLRDSARTEIETRAMNTVKGNISVAEEEVMAAEITRLMELDRLDVKFGLEGRIGLDSPELREHLQPNDRLVVMFESPEGKPGIKTGVVFTWTKDGNEQLGWVLTREIVTNDTYTITNVRTKGVPKDLFVQPGTQLPDLVNRTTLLKPGLIVAQAPLIVCWNTPDGKAGQQALDISIRQDGYGYRSSDAKVSPVNVASIDFQVRDLRRVSA